MSARHGTISDPVLGLLAVEMDGAAPYPYDYAICMEGVADRGVYLRRENDGWHVFLAWRRERAYERTFADEDADGAADYFRELVHSLRRSRVERRLDRDEFRRQAAALQEPEVWSFSFDPAVLPAGWQIVEEDDGWLVWYCERGDRVPPPYHASSEHEALGFVLEQFELAHDLDPPELALP